MRTTRVIPVLLLQGDGLVKTKKFKNPVYVGDPINAIKIFNEKEIDELVFLDIEASAANVEPNYELLEEFASEAFFPLAYGGGIRNLEQAKRIFRIGVEKIVLSTYALNNPQLVNEIASYAGNSSIVVCLDIHKPLFRDHRLFNRSKVPFVTAAPFEAARLMTQQGAGEIIINHVDRDGTSMGYDLELVTKMAASVSVPVIAMGGAGGIGDFSAAVKAGASAVAAGRYFVFYGKHEAVLITYPSEKELDHALP